MAETDPVEIPVTTKGFEEAMRNLDKAKEKTEETRKEAGKGGGALSGAGVGAAVGGFAGATIGTVASQTGLGNAGLDLIQGLLGALVIKFSDEIKAVIDVLKDIKEAVGGTFEEAKSGFRKAKEELTTVEGTGADKITLREIGALVAAGGTAGATVGFGAGAFTGPGALAGAGAGLLIGGGLGLATGVATRAKQEIREEGLLPEDKFPDPGTAISQVTGKREEKIGDPDVLPGSGAAARNATAPTAGGIS